jgi:hypothetical protein
MDWLQYAQPDRSLRGTADMRGAKSFQDRTFIKVAFTCLAFPMDFLLAWQIGKKNTVTAHRQQDEDRESSKASES